MGVFVEFICDAHATHDPMGPLVTRHVDAWAYCAGHAASDHRWRRIAPIRRELLERAPAKVDLICGGAKHVQRGLSVPDGQGILTISGHTWAYCSAAMDETHDWRRVEPIAFRDIEHDRIAELIEPR